jgi:hypothetical protein
VTVVDDAFGATRLGSYLFEALEGPSRGN